MELATQQFIRVMKLKMHRYYLIQEKVEKLLKSDSLSTILRSFFCLILRIASLMGTVGILKIETLKFQNII